MADAVVVALGEEVAIAGADNPLIQYGTDNMLHIRDLLTKQHKSPHGIAFHYCAMV